eukprot:4726787-Pleurochrysis_carterae.AAC.1
MTAFRNGGTRLAASAGCGGEFDIAVVGHVDVHPEELLEFRLHCQLETLAKQAQVLVRFHAARVCHPAVVHVEHEINS